MSVHVAILMAALCNISSTGVSAFQLRASRTRFSCQHGSQLASGGVERVVERVRCTAAGRSLLYGIDAEGSGSEGMKVRLVVRPGIRCRSPSQQRGYGVSVW